MKAAAAILQFFIVLPTWYFLVYSMLSAIHPDRLVWFLFWVYVPMALISVIISYAAFARDGK